MLCISVRSFVDCLRPAHAVAWIPCVPLQVTTPLRCLDRIFAILVVRPALVVDQAAALATLAVLTAGPPPPVDPALVEAVALFRVDGMHLSVAQLEHDVISLARVHEAVHTELARNIAQARMLPHHKQILALAAVFVRTCGPVYLFGGTARVVAVARMV